MNRGRTQRALERYFTRRTYPRVIMSTIVFATGGAGFYASVAFLRLGLDRMWIRYLAAFAVAYLVFLLLVRLWVALERGRFIPNEEDTTETTEPASGSFDSPDVSNWKDWLDVPNFDLDLEGCAVGIVFAAVAAIVIGAVLLVAAAPALLAEVFLDAVLMTVLYRRLRKAALHHWLGTAIARTWQPMLIAAALYALAGAILQAIEPGSHTLGDFWRRRHPLF